jgi:hypothetical protein
MASTDRKLLEKIRELADGRRHYDGQDGYTCFDALGDIRELCDQHVGPPAACTCGKPFCAECVIRSARGE